VQLVLTSIDPLECQADGVNLETKTGRGRHKVMVARFLKYLAAHPNRPIYLTEICAAICVSERTLRAACEEYLEMGPIRYLNLRRMHQVRQALLGADPSKATVTSVVTDHGFWELGRFSVAYRALFGESPSETLRRPVIKPPPKKAAWLNVREPNVAGPAVSPRITVECEHLLR
jgi:transcriptional regulator GlxA family with amidase domain